MGITDLKIRLRDVAGADSLTMQIIGGRQVFFIAGQTVAMDALATDQEIETAIRAAAQKEPAMSVTGAPYAAGSFSARLKAIRERVQQGSTKMDSALNEMENAATAHARLAETVSSEATALMAELAQFTNGEGGS